MKYAARQHPRSIEPSCWWFAATLLSWRRFGETCQPKSSEWFTSNSKIAARPSSVERSQLWAPFDHGLVTNQRVHFSDELRIEDPFHASVQSPRAWLTSGEYDTQRTAVGLPCLVVQDPVLVLKPIVLAHPEVSNQEVAKADLLSVVQLFLVPAEAQLRVVREHLEELLIRGEHGLSHLSPRRLGVLLISTAR